MFTVIYRFEVKKDRETAFIRAWEALTILIRDYAGGMGSRLHREKENTYLAYAQWPDRETWENSGNKLPEDAAPLRQQMRECCEKTETLFELAVVKDLLVKG